MSEKKCIMSFARVSQEKVWRSMATCYPLYRYFIEKYDITLTEKFPGTSDVFRCRMASKPYSNVLKIHASVEPPNELLILQSIRHPNIVALESSFYDNEKSFYGLVLEFVSQDLFAFMENNDWQIDNSVLFNVTHDIGMALIYLHSKNIVHMDIKMENILVKKASPLAFILCDFGCSEKLKPCNQCFEKSIPCDHVTMDKPVGTLNLMAPEVQALIEEDDQIISEQNRSGYLAKPCDVFSFAMMLYAMIFKEWFDGENILFDNILFKNILSNNSSKELHDLFEKCLSFDPQARPSIFQMVYEFERLFK